MPVLLHEYIRTKLVFMLYTNTFAFSLFTGIIKKHTTLQTMPNAPSVCETPSQTNKENFYGNFLERLFLAMVYKKCCLYTSSTFSQSFDWWLILCDNVANKKKLWLNYRNKKNFRLDTFEWSVQQQQRKVGEEELYF